MKDIIIAFDEPVLSINQKEEDKLRIKTQEAVSVITPLYHKDFLGLDYESSGHTGFASEKDIENINNELSNKQPIGDYATKTELNEGLATKQPIGEYATRSEIELKADKTYVDDELSKKQPLGDYATNTSLTQGLESKQDKGDYATRTELEEGLSGKQPIGDYATKSDINNIIGGAPETFDTLKEISDWIANDEEGTAALLNRVNQSEIDIENIKNGTTEVGVANKVKNILTITKDGIAIGEFDGSAPVSVEIPENTSVTGGGTVYSSEKNSLETSDADIISNFFQQNPEIIPKTGDVFLINTIIDKTLYEISSYIYNISDWEAITGNVDAEKVIFRKNITLAGNYTQVGNLTKTQTGTAEFNITGKSCYQAFQEMLSKRQQPSIISQPSVSGFSLNGARAVEAGTTIVSAVFGTARLNAGQYTQFPNQVPTGVVAQSYSVDRIANPSSLSKTGIVTAASGTDNNDGNGFIIGDQGGANVVSSLQYKVTIQHNEGAVALDNLGEQSNPEVKIAAGSKSQTTSAYTPFRNVFYGTSSLSSVPALDSAYIRGLNKTNSAYKAQVLTLNVPAGATQVTIACISTATGVTKIINETALNADVTSTFTKSIVSVEGSNGYTAVNYNVWNFIPAAPYGQSAVLKVTLG